MIKIFRQAAFTAVFAATLCGAAFAATKPPSAAMMAPIQAALAAVNMVDAAKLNGVLTPDATIVDEFAPYSWSGPASGKAWLASFADFMKQAKATDVKGVLREIKNFDVAGNRAYIVVPVNFSGKVAGKPFHETGTWTFTLVKSGSKWLAQTISWGRVSMSM